MRVARLPGIHHDANSTLFIGKEATVLIDVGTSWYQLLIEERIKGVLEEGGLDAILLTSRRFAHSGGAAHIAEAFGDIPVHIESSAAGALSMGDFASTGAARFDSEMPRIDTESVVEGQEWDLGEHTLKAISTPGHSPDGMAYWLPEKRIAAVGSLIPMAGSPARWDMMGGNLLDLADSVESLLDLELEMLIPGFGDAIRGRSRVRSVIRQHLGFLEGCIRTDGQPPENWSRPAQTATFLTPRTPWVIAEEE